MEYVYVMYNAAETCVMGVFTSLAEAESRVKNDEEFESVFIKKVPLNCIYYIEDINEDVVWPYNGHEREVENQKARKVNTAHS